MGDVSTSSPRRACNMDSRANMGRTRTAGMIVMVIILAAIAVGAIVSIVEN